MSHKITETKNGTIFQEYLNKQYFEIEFTNCCIKSRTKQLETDPIERTEDNISYFNYINKLNKKIQKHKI